MTTKPHLSLSCSSALWVEVKEKGPCTGKGLLGKSKEVKCCFSLGPASMSGGGNVH